MGYEVTKNAMGGQEGRTRVLGSTQQALKAAPEKRGAPCVPSQSKTKEDHRNKGEHKESVVRGAQKSLQTTKIRAETQAVKT